MIHLLWTLWVRVATPPILLGMGLYSLRKIRREWDTLRWYDRLVVTFNAIAMPILGVLSLAISLWVLAA